jgi:hypothetical protein
MNGSPQLIQIDFSKLGHFWLDSGLVGLIKLLEEVQPANIEMIIRDNKLSLRGEKENIKIGLQQAYDLLIDRYYNLSTKKQRDDITSYNFYYDTKKDEFFSFPKRKSVGVAGIIYNKAPRPTGGSIAWAEKVDKSFHFNGKIVKKKRGILPEEYAHLQERLDSFLDRNGLDVTTAGLLTDGPNAVKPNVNIQISSKKKGEYCYLCGEESGALDEANQTIFPFLTGSSGVLSFNPEAGKPEKICWKCALIGKFVPVNSFYSNQGDNLYVFLPYSNSLEKVCNSYDLLQESKYEDPNLFHNFQHPLGGYYQRPFEIAFAFLFTLYDKLRIRKQDFSGNETEALDVEALMELTLNKAPLEFYVIHTKDEGSTFAGKMIWPFKESFYFFRLLREIETLAKVQMKEALFYCIDFTQPKAEVQTMIRDKICERLLKKQSILDLIEQHVFHAQLDYFKPLFDMVLVYELLIKEGNEVFKEEQEAAVELGRKIGMAVGKNEHGKKGDLFALRKSRRKVDFLEQINRLQFKLGQDFVVPKEVYEGKLTDENFNEFKQFSMLAALNSFNFCKNEKKAQK